jgi:hypothetical protein
VVTSKWVYKIKHATDGSVDKYKARFMARGFSQKEGEDYDKTSTLVARYTSIRAIISLVALLYQSYISYHISIPDIFFVVNTLSQFQVEPRQENWIAAKQVLTYIHETINYGLRYTTSSDIQLHGFTDFDWAGSVEDRKSTSSMCFNLGSAMISWGSRKPKTIALSTAKAEYMAACEACTEAVWLRKLISDLFDQIPESTIIYCDNQSCIRLSEHPVFHERSKHIEIKYYFIRDKFQEGEVKLEYIPTDEQTTDILTKPLSRIKFAYF